MQEMLANLVEHPVPESMAFDPDNSVESLFSPTIGVVLDFLILYRMEDDSRRLTNLDMNCAFRTDDYGILHISSHYEQADERELAVRRHLTREFKLHGFEMNLIDNHGECYPPCVDDSHPNTLNCEDPLHCRWSFDRTYSVALDDQMAAEMSKDHQLRDVTWLALRLVSPAMDASEPGSMEHLGQAVKLLNGWRTFVNDTCEFNLHYGNGLQAFSTSALKTLAQAIWLMDPIMDSYHPEHRRDVLYPPYSREKINGSLKWANGIPTPCSAVSRSNLANHMTAADVARVLREGEVRWGQEMWDEGLLAAGRAPPGLEAALAELGACASTFAVAALMAPMPRPAYDFSDYLWRDVGGGYLVGGPQLVLRQHRPTLDWRLVQAWALVWTAIFARALVDADTALAGDTAAALGPLAAAHRELRATDGLFWAQRRAQARLRQFLAWLGLDYIADLWELPPPPVEPI